MGTSTGLTQFTPSGVHQAYGDFAGRTTGLLVADLAHAQQTRYTIAGRTLVWTWDQSSGETLTGFRIYWGSASGARQFSYDVTDPDARTASVGTVIGAWGSWYVVVVAVGASGEGSASNEYYLDENAIYPGPAAPINSNLSQSQTLAAVAVTQKHTLAVSNIAQAQGVQSVTFSKNSLTVADLRHVQLVQPANLSGTSATTLAAAEASRRSLDFALAQTDPTRAPLVVVTITTADGVRVYCADGLSDTEVWSEPVVTADGSVLADGSEYAGLQATPVLAIEPRVLSYGNLRDTGSILPTIAMRGQRSREVGGVEIRLRNDDDHFGKLLAQDTLLSGALDVTVGFRGLRRDKFLTRFRGVIQEHVLTEEEFRVRAETA